MTGPRILVAEDDPSVRLTIRFILEHEGFDVTLAEDGVEALDLARSTSPDAILLDQIMPKMDGKEVFAALKADGDTTHIPVIVLSGMGRSTDPAWAGASFVGKPFSPDELVACIRGVVSAAGA
jgi:two-component system phosphate regulon response regulator PhoB